MPTEKKPDRWLLLLTIMVAASFMVKLLFLIDLQYLPLLGDDYLYWDRSLSTLGNYFTQLDLQAPLYEFFLATNKLIFRGHALLVVKIEQIMLQSVEVFLIYFLASRFFSRKAAAISGIIAAIYPELVSYSYILFSETFFLFFSLCSVILYFSAMRSEKDPGPALMAGSGFLFGIASLVRSVNFYFFPLVILHFLLFGRQPARGRLISIAAFFLAMIAPVSIQTIKNYRVEGCFVLIDRSAPRNFYRSHNISYPINMDFRANNTLTVDRAPCPEANVCAQTKCESANSLKFIAGNPGIFLKHAAIKVVNLYSPNLIIYKNIFKADASAFKRAGLYQGRWLRALGSISYLLLMLLAIMGIVLAREWEFRGFTLMLVFYHTALCAFFLGASRYRMPFTPFLVIYAGSVLAMSRKDLSELKSWKIYSALALWLVLVFAVWRRLFLTLS